MAALTFDWTINLTSIMGTILVGLVTYFGRTVIGYISDITYRLDVLWDDYSKRHPEEFKTIPGRDRRKRRAVILGEG